MIEQNYELAFYRRAGRMDEAILHHPGPYGAWADGITVQVWLDDGKYDGENLITVNGLTYAYCSSDDAPSDWDNIEQVGTAAFYPTMLIALGMAFAQAAEI